jgi:hypothetical protein
MHYDAMYFVSDGPPKFSRCCDCLCRVLKTGWTPERAASFYGGMSETKMRSMVAYPRQHGFLRRSA